MWWARKAGAFPDPWGWTMRKARQPTSKTLSALICCNKKKTKIQRQGRHYILDWKYSQETSHTRNSSWNPWLQGFSELSGSQTTRPEGCALAHPRADNEWLKFEPLSWELRCNGSSSIQTPILSSFYVQHKVTADQGQVWDGRDGSPEPSPAEDKWHLGEKFGN